MKEFAFSVGGVSCVTNRTYARRHHRVLPSPLLMGGGKVCAANEDCSWDLLVTTARVKCGGGQSLLRPFMSATWLRSQLQGCQEQMSIALALVLIVTSPSRNATIRSTIMCGSIHGIHIYRCCFMLMVPIVHSILRTPLKRRWPPKLETSEQHDRLQRELHHS